MGYKHKILIIQEDISGREIVEVKFMGGKIKEKTFGRQRINLRREIWEGNWGNEIQGIEDMGLQSWGDIEEK